MQIRRTKTRIALERKLSADNTAILSDAEVAALTRLVRAAVGDSPARSNMRLQDSVRWTTVRARCRQARAERGVTIKQAAVALGVAQYRLKAIEMGLLGELRAEIARRYFRFLGIEAWVDRWCEANRGLARRVGLQPVSRRRRRKVTSETQTV